MSERQPGTARVREVFELAFECSADFENPFADIAVDVEFTRPDGTSFRHPAFYDGDGTWKVRISPDRAGLWHYRSQSTPIENSLLHEGDFEVTETEGRGFLTSVPGSRTGFRYENGEDVYLLGDTTYDLFGMAYCGGNVHGFVRRRLSQGYRMLRVRVPVSRFHPPNSECRWQTRRCWAWGGSEQSPLFDRFNLDWFRNVDQVMDMLEAEGMGVEMIMEAWGFEFPFNHRTRFTAEYEALWLRYLIARYDAYSSVYFWTPLNEYEYWSNGDWNWKPASDRWLLRIARWIKATASHGHPVAAHNGPTMPPFAERFRADPEAVDTIMFQCWGARDANAGWLAAGIDDQARQSLAGWKGTAMLAEWGYERLDDVDPDFPSFANCDRNHSRRGAWRGAFCGLPIANGFVNSWSPLMELEDDQPGVGDLARTRQFMQALYDRSALRPNWSIQSDLPSGYGPLVLQGEGLVAVYLPAGGRCDLPGSGEWRLSWYDPRSGECSTPTQIVAQDDLLAIHSPEGEDQKGRPLDWVALIERAA